MDHHLQKPQSINFRYSNSNSNGFVNSNSSSQIINTTGLKRAQTMNGSQFQPSQVVRVPSPVAKIQKKITYPVLTTFTTGFRVKPKIDSLSPGRYYSGYDEKKSSANQIDTFQYRIYKITNSLINQISRSILDITKAQVDKITEQRQLLGERENQYEAFSKRQAQQMLSQNNEDIKNQMRELIRQVTYLNQNKKQPRTVWLDIDLGKPYKKISPALKQDNNNLTQSQKQKQKERQKRQQKDFQQYLIQKVFKIISDVLSVSFNLHFKDGMEYNKVKAYCSQNFLYNFCKLAKSVQLNADMLKFIQLKLQEDILPYLNLSYPRSEQRNMNKQLKSKITEKDVFNQNRFDLVFNSKQQLSTKQVQTNAEVMRIMNYIIRLPDQKPIIYQNQRRIISKKTSLNSQNEQLFKMDSKTETKERMRLNKAPSNVSQMETVKINQSFISGDQSQLIPNIQLGKSHIEPKKVQTKQSKTYYELFQQDMDAIYNKVYNEDLINSLYKMDNQSKKQLTNKLNIIIKPQSSKAAMQQINKYILQLDDTNLQGLKTDEQKKQKMQQQYKQKVQGYTKFLIGRKVSGNVTPYTEAEIQEGSIIIKDSAVARILMKWVQALQQQLNDPSKSVYLRDQPFRLSNKQETYQLSSKKNLKQLYSFYQRSAKIIKEKSQILKTNARQVFLQALKVFENNSYSEYKTFSSDKDALIGHICTWVEKSKQSHISTYLAMLINQIKLIQQEYEKLIQDKKVNINSRPSLLNLKLGDLMRCLIVSKPKEIIALYQYIDLLCKYDSQRFQLVRVKDRSNTPNKDILINIYYYKKVMIEMQLAIKNDSQFLNCSDKFSHFIYQMERAFLGTVNQMCSIWSQYSPKSEFFFKRFHEINTRSKTNLNQSCGDQRYKIKHHFEEQDNRFKLPFLCSSCGVFYSTGQTSRKLCSQCKLYQCGMCQIRHDKQKREQYLLKHYKDYEQKQQSQIGKIFYGLDISSAHFNFKTLIKLEINGKITVYSMDIIDKNQGKEANQNSILMGNKKNTSLDSSGVKKPNYQIKNIKQQYEVSRKNKHKFKRKQFQQSHILLAKKSPDINNKIDQNSQKSQNIEMDIQKQFSYDAKMLGTKQDAKQDVFTKKVIKQILKNSYLPVRMNNIIKKSQRFMKLSVIVVPQIAEEQKGAMIYQLLSANKNKLGELQKLNLNQLGLAKLDLQNNLPKIRTIVLTNNRISSLNLSGFLSLISLQLSSNKIVSIKNLINLKNCVLLKKLLLDTNQLIDVQGLPKQLTELQVLSLNNNKIKDLLQFPVLAQLKSLNLNNNCLSNIKPITNCINLQQLKIRNNKNIGIDGISILKLLKNLKVLDISKIKLKRALNISQNFNLDQSYRQQNSSSKHQSLNSLMSLQNLVFLNASYNQLKNFPKLKQLKKIKQLDFSHNLLQQIQSVVCFTQLRWLNLCKNQIKSLQGLEKLTSLQWLNLSINHIEDISCLSKMKTLHQLKLNRNRITQLSKLGSLPKLYELKVRYNNIASLKGLQLPNLDQLDVSKNQLESLQGISDFKNLRELRISANINLCGFTEQDEKKNLQQIGELKNLRILKLNQIGLKTISSIPKIKNLQQLYVSYNQLKNLIGIANFQSLKKLQIQGNKVQSFQQLKQTKFLSSISVSLINFDETTSSKFQGIESLQVFKVHYNSFSFDKERTQAYNKFKQYMMKHGHRFQQEQQYSQEPSEKQQSEEDYQNNEKDQCKVISSSNNYLRPPPI